ncbi:MAG: ComF family protein [Elusimicrobiaceae bacterium]|nr:ComF family protein [Elusimicrobiaceae bacterium]
MKYKIKIILDKIINFFLPRTCFYCGADLKTKTLLCEDCFKKVEVIKGLICQRCGVPLKYGGQYCYNCRGSKATKYKCSFIRSALKFNEPTRALVHAFKYEKYLNIAPYFAEVMYKTFKQNPEYLETSFLVPVPIYKSRQRKRGFNQAEVLANHLSKLCGIPVLNALVRIKNTKSQTKLTREQRKENISGAFALVKGMEGQIKKEAIILIDDVCTTSATLEECARVLKAAGAREVLALTALRE